MAFPAQHGNDATAGARQVLVRDQHSGYIDFEDA